MKSIKLPAFTAALAAVLFAWGMVPGCASAPKERETFEFTEASAAIDAGDHLIPAVITLPAAEGRRFPVVVMLHGFASNKDEAGGGYRLLASALARNGIASVRIDFMGCGDSTASHLGFTLDTGVAEARAALDFAAALPEIDAGRAGIMGWSKGGSIALLTAGRDARFKSVVTWAGALDLSGGVYTESAYSAAKRAGTYTSTFDWRGPLEISLQAFEVARATDIGAEFAKSGAPVFSIGGSNDTVVPPASAEKIRSFSRNTASTVLIITGADHTFNIFSGDRGAFNIVSRETVEWFRDTL